MNNIPRYEHPRPDRKRDAWINLNGEWDFEIDNAKVGTYKKYYLRDSLDSKITVPFCPESKLSGIGNTDFMYSVWYRRDINIPDEWKGKRVILHIDASDFLTTAYVNGKEVGHHSGGYTSFAFDITKALKDSDNYITIHAEDNLGNGKQFLGKQSIMLDSYGCSYTRTTGIWQTVWLEAVEEAYVKSYKVYANVAKTSVGLDVLVSDAGVGGTLKVSASYEGKPMGSAEAYVNGNNAYVNIELSEAHLWEVGKGRLYDLKFELIKDQKTDILDGYFGLREVALTREKGMQINGKTIFGRFVLDQGFYPDGIITAPSDEALVFDIKASMSCGFNGARLHQKVFEPRFLYHADRLGYMVWGETGNWGFDHTTPNNFADALPEWLEEIERDFSHPSVIGWCPFNETWDKEGRRQYNPLLDAYYDVTKAIDSTRPVVTSSGSLPTERTDVHDVHEYEQDPALFGSYFAEIEQGKINDQLTRRYPNRQISKTYLPIFVSEYGGIKWVEGDGIGSWGYGASVKTEDEFFERLKGLTDVLLDNKDIFAFCYTQLTDVEQEKNGLLTYERVFKFRPEKFAAVFGKKAVIED